MSDPKTTNAVLVPQWGPHKGKPIYVQYNPNEFSLDKGVQLAEINIPGLDAPLQQFIRGQAEKLTVELFFDTTDDGMGKRVKSVTEYTDQISMLAKIESDSHAPPVVTFCWNDSFPGGLVPAKTSEAGGKSNQSRTSFTGVVESVRQKFTLFNPDGVPLRATVNLTLREYRTLPEQLKQLNRNSPDKSHSHPLQAEETLSAIAGRYWRRSDAWRHIADENEIEDPRRVEVGRVLNIPVITGGLN